MPKATFTKPFKFSPNGVDIVEYERGSHDVSDRCAEVAEEAGALAEAKTKAAPKKAAAKTAPENAAAGAAPETK